VGYSSVKVAETADEATTDGVDQEEIVGVAEEFDEGGAEGSGSFGGEMGGVADGNFKEDDEEEG